MRKNSISFLLFLIAFQNIELIGCNSDAIPIKIISRPAAGNEEGTMREQGTHFLHVNGVGIPFYDDESSKLCKDSEKDCADTNTSMQGCIPKKILTVKGTNKFVFGITNISASTYVHTSHDVILSPDSARKLYLWRNLLRQGTYPNHSYRGETQKDFSYLVLTTQNGAAIEKTQSSIAALIESTKSVLSRTSKEYNELLVAEKILSELKDKSIFEIDLDKRNVPSWFKELVRTARDTNEKLKGDVVRKISELEQEARSMAAEAQKILTSMDVSLPTPNSDTCEFDEIIIEEFSKYDDGKNYPSDNTFSRQADSVISRLGDYWAREDRVGFLQAFYAWQQQHETLAPIISSRTGLVPGEQQAFLANHSRVMQTVRKYVDDRFYFHASQIPQSTKDAIDYSIAKSSPSVGKELKLAVNTLKVSNEKTQRAFKSIEDLALGYQDTSAEEKPFWDRIGRGLAAYIKGLAQNTAQIADCMLKSMSAGPYAEFYELTHGKSFCTDEELDTLDLAISAGSLSMSAAGLIGGPVVGAAGSALGKGLSFVKKVFGKVLKPFWKGKIEKALGSVDSAKTHNISLKRLDATRLKNNPLNQTRYTDKVRLQMQQDKFHGFPKQVDNFAGLGKKSELVGGDGIKRTKIQLEGEYLERKGNFEWIVEPDGSINHRKFEPFR